jgi:hypothetical protein
MTRRLGLGRLLGAGLLVWLVQSTSASGQG